MEISNFETEISLTQASKLPVQSDSLSRHAFMKLPLKERRSILAEQDEVMLLHYQQDKEWQGLQTGELIDY